MEVCGLSGMWNRLLSVIVCVLLMMAADGTLYPCIRIHYAMQ